MNSCTLVASYDLSSLLSTLTGFSSFPPAIFPRLLPQLAFFWVQLRGSTFLAYRSLSARPAIEESKSILPRTLKCLCNNPGDYKSDVLSNGGWLEYLSTVFGVLLVRRSLLDLFDGGVMLQART